MKLSYAFILIFLTLSKAAFSGVSILNGLTHEFTGTAGETMHGEVVLFNTSTEPQRVRFELNEAIFSCTGNRQFIPFNPHAKSLSEWFKGEVTEITIAPKERYVFRFAITIPEDKDLRGSFWSVLMVNVENPIKEDQLSGNIGLDTRIRYAVALLAHVSSPGPLALKINSVEVDQNEALPGKTMNVAIQNQGIFSEGISLSLEVYQTDGTNVAEFSTDRNLVFPGFCKDFSIDISALPPGSYQCVLVAEAREEFSGTYVNLTIND